jgi:hypothetical protein
MRDKRIWEFKRRAEEDNLITAGCCRLLLRLASWRYCTRHHPADSEFSLSWRDMAAWYDNEGPEAVKNERTIYKWMREAVLNRYLFYNGRKGCPAQSCYRLDLDHKPERLTLFDWAATRASQVAQKNTELVREKTTELVREKNAQPVARKTTEPVAQKSAAPINRYSLREEMYKTKGKKFEPRAARGKKKKNGVGAPVRDRTRDLAHGSGKDASTGPAQKELPTEDRATQGCDLSAVGKAGGTNPPGRGSNAPASLAKINAEAARKVALHAARFYLEQGQTQYLDVDHVAALLRAGEKVPDDVMRKFPALKGRRKKGEAVPA